MNLPLHGDDFGNVLVIGACAACIGIAITFIIANRRGIEVSNICFQRKVYSIWIIIFVLMPFWLCDLSIEAKIELTILAVAVGVGDFIFLTKMERLGAKYREKKAKETEKRV